MIKYGALAGLFAIALSGLPASAQWYVGGSLHRATGLEWKSASVANRLATAADFTTTMIGEAKIKKLGSFDRVKPLALELVECLDEAVAGKTGNSLRVSEVAATCAVLMGWR